MYFVHSFPDRFVLYDSVRFVELLIDRSTGSIQKRTKADNLGNQIDANVHSEKADIIVGIIQLLRCKYLILGISSIPIGEYHGFSVRQCTEFKLLPFDSDKYHNNHHHSNHHSAPISLLGASLNPNQLKDETLYLQLLNKVLANGKWYFSYDGDITLSSQRLAEFQLNQANNNPSNNSGNNGINSTPSTLNSFPYQRADNRYFWNRYISSDLIRSQADEFIIPMINGYFFQQRLKLRNREIIFTLISRRSKERAGKRFITRGLDLQGNAANFAETEQIITVIENNNVNPPSPASVFSFLQTRGSIPVLWSQPVTMKYTPKIIMQNEGKETELAFRRHFDYQTSHYGRNICINLVNQKGAELQLVQAFQRQIDLTSSPAIRLINWDFHHECRKMKYENIQNLIHLMKDEFPKQSYFFGLLGKSNYNNGNNNNNNIGNNNNNQNSLSSRFIEVKQRQSGVFRTNCIDCLDRTNVVQSVLAKKLLMEQLIYSTGMTENELSQLSALESMFKNVWANNADAMSIPYSGTGALKTDYTRTGKRSTRGAIQDGINSVTRYYLNNFKDGFNQDSIDLLLGIYQPNINLNQYDSPYIHLHNSSVSNTQKKLSIGYQKSITSFIWRFQLSMILILLLLYFLLPLYYKNYIFQYDISIQIGLFLVLSLIIGGKLLLRYGRHYVSKPSLRPKE